MGPRGRLFLWSPPSTPPLPPHHQVLATLNVSTFSSSPPWSCTEEIFSYPRAFGHAIPKAQKAIFFASLLVDSQPKREPSVKAFFDPCPKGSPSSPTVSSGLSNVFARDKVLPESRQSTMLGYVLWRCMYPAQRAFTTPQSNSYFHLTDKETQLGNESPHILSLHS